MCTLCAEGVNREGRIDETLDGGQTWQCASSNLRVPWPEQMVDRFVHDGDRLIAVLSTGMVLAESPKMPKWGQILSNVEGVTAVTVEESDPKT